MKFYAANPVVAQYLTERELAHKEIVARELELKLKATAAWRELNNLYLAIESGKRRVTIITSNDLRVLIGEAYPHAYDGQMREWWERELFKLPGWFEV